MTRTTALPSQFTTVPFHIAEGASAALSEKRMRGRDLRRPFAGVRIAGASELSVLERCRAYSERPVSGQVFSHATAAQIWQMPLPSWLEADGRIHVSTYDGGNRPRLAGVVGHQLTDPAIRLVARHGLRVLDPASVWLQLAAVLPVDDLVAAGDHLVLTPRCTDPADPRPFISMEKLADRVRRFRGRGRRNALLALQLVRDGAESPKETTLRLALVRRGLPEPVLNREILDEVGERIGYGDLVYPEFRVVVEYEGEQHRTDSKQFYKDIERHERFVRAGWIHLRETKETPPTGPRSAPWRTHAALRERGWHHESPQSAPWGR